MINEYNVIVGNLRQCRKWSKHIVFSLRECRRKSVILIPAEPNSDEYARKGFSAYSCVYMFHFRNNSGEAYGKDEVERLLRSVGAYLKVGDVITSRGGCTPGGLSAVKWFADYGFEKCGEYHGWYLYWAGREMDSDKFAEWVANPKHKDDFVFLGDFGDASPAYTSPVIWELRKKSDNC